MDAKIDMKPIEKIIELHEKDSNVGWLIYVWLFYAVLCIGLSVVLAYLLALAEVSPLLSFSLGLLFTFVLPVIGNFKTVPSGEYWVMTLFGKYCTIYLPGLRLPIPFFMKRRARVSSKEEKFTIFPLENKSQTDLVEFKDGSAAVDATFYCIVEDPFKLIIGVANAATSLIKRMESVVRIFLGAKSLDEAISSKTEFDLATVLSGGASTDKDYTKEEIFQSVREDWGIILTNLTISDLTLSDADMEIRRKRLVAEKETEVAEILVKKAKHEADAVIEKAKGELEALKKRGAGLAEQVEFLKSKGLSAEKAAEYLAVLRKWEAIENNDGTTIIDNIGKGTAGSGLQFGTGFHHSQKNKGGN